LFSKYSVCSGRLIRTSDVSYVKLFVVLACGLLIAMTGCGFSSGSTSEGPLSVSPGSVSFGSVSVGQTASTKVALVNVTAAPLTISQVSVSGENFFLNSQSNLPVTINGGSAYNFQIGFKPGGSSSYTGQFTIIGPGGRQIYVGPISGQGKGNSGNGNSATSILSVSATTLTFGNQTVGSPATQPVTLTSSGTSTVTINSATISGTGFTVSGGAFPDRLNPGQSLTLNVQFDPSAVGLTSGALTIQSDSVSNNPGVVSLSGTGTQLASPQLMLSTSSLTFGDVTVNTPSKQPVTLTSTGTAPVTINSAALTGTGFTMSGAKFPVSLNPSQSVTLDLQFDPATIGPASGQLTVLSNSASNSNAVVNLSGTGSAATSPQLSLSAATLSFGNVTVNSTTTLPETLTSSGTAPVTINSATVSGAGFAVAGTTLPVTLNPGQSVTLKVQCDPTSAGAASGQLTIQSNSATNSTATVSLTGAGTAATSPQLTLSTASLTFGNVTVNTASTQPVTLTSTGTSPVTINSAALTGAGFTMSGVSFPVTLNPNQSVTLNTRFDPTAVGAASGQLTIQSDSSTNSTATVNLSGTGTAATSPQLTLSAASLTFGDVTVNTSSTQPVTLTSTGTAPVTINSAATGGTEFTVSGSTFPVTLNAGQSVTLNVQFDPTAPGAESDQLTIQSTSSTNSTAIVSLNGTGTAASSPQLTLSAVSLSFGSVTLNTSSTLPVTLSSTGTAPVSINSATLTGTDFTMSGGSFPATLNPGQSVTLNVQFNPTATGPASGQISIQSDSSTNSNAVVNLSGTGASTVVTSPNLTVSPASLAFGNVTLNTPTTLPVTLTSSGTAPVTITSASLTGTGFTMSGATFPVTLNPTQSVTVNVQFDPTAAGAATGQLTIQSNSSTNGTVVVGLSGSGTAAPGVLSALSCSNASMTGAGSDSCTVTLSSAAGNSGVSVGLSSSSTAVTVPATVVVPANATSAGFTATVSSVTTAQSVTLTATSGSVSKTFALQLNAAVPTLTVSPTALAFGNVTLNTPTTLPVTLTSSGTAPVTITSASLTGTGFTMSGATFPVTLNPTLAITLEVQFDPTAAGAATGQLTIQSNSSTNATVVVGLSGTGGSTSHQVTLTWDAPGSSSDPVAGYNVYRSASGSSTYQLLNSSVETGTSYVDTNVQSGSTYDYIVKSVDASGVESTASNEATATIP